MIFHSHQEYYGILKSVSLFLGIEKNELEDVFNCINAVVEKKYKDEIILCAGEKPDFIGIVLAGQIHIVREDCDGHRTVLGAVVAGDIFAEALCCAGVAESPVTVIADSEAVVMLLSFSRLLRTCSHTCSFHAKLIENMIGVIAQKALQLQEQMEIISLKTIRAKMTRYLESLAPLQGRTITVPFNRGELADYLCVERSALSHELARMKMEGLIEYKKNVFHLMKI